MISTIPFGIGLIWAYPMMVAMMGVMLLELMPQNLGFNHCRQTWPSMVFPSAAF